MRSTMQKGKLPDMFQATFFHHCIALSADLRKWEGDNIGGCIGLILVARVGLVGSILIFPCWSTRLGNRHQDESLGAVICPAIKNNSIRLAHWLQMNVHSALGFATLCWQ